MSHREDQDTLVPLVARCLTTSNERIDGETETFIPEVAPTLLAGGNATGGTRPPGTTVDTADSLLPMAFMWQAGGNNDASGTVQEDHTPTLPKSQTVAVAYTVRADAMREGTAKTPSADAEGRVRLRDPGMGVYEEIAPTLDCGQAHGVAHPITPFDTTQITSAANRSNPKPGDPCHPLAALRSAHPPAVATPMAVRRLTPTECERLQGFPDGWTDGQADSSRYRQLGNAVCVPVAEWIGRRIVEVSNA